MRGWLLSVPGRARLLRSAFGLSLALVAGAAQGFVVNHVGTGSSSENLIMQYLVGDGDGVQIANLTVENGRRSNSSANQRQLGYFTQGSAPLGISQGVLFTTGRVSDVTSSAPDGSIGIYRASYI